MSYMVDEGRGKRKYFSTLDEANGYANWYMRVTKVVLGVFESKHKVTHTFGKEIGYDYKTV